MREKSIHCPETDEDCFDPDCSIKICFLSQARVIREQREQEWLAHLRQTLREPAAWRVIQEHWAEHNSRIRAGQPGILTKDGGPYDDLAPLPVVGILYQAVLPNGEIFTPLKPLPTRGRSAVEVSKLVEKLLASKKESVIARIEQAIDKIILEDQKR